MSYLIVKNLTKSYTDSPLFDHINFSVEKGQKIAIVAKNWAWKSTLLKVLMDDVESEDWEVSFMRWVSVGFLSQDMNFDPNSLVLDFIYESDKDILNIIKHYEKIVLQEHYSQEEFDKAMTAMEENRARDYEARIKSIINKLNLNNLLTQKISTLSWWELKRLALAKVLVKEPDFLILDEPTNHLDLQMIERLENYLAKSNVTLLMVTHDRYFLERVCNMIFELDRASLHVYPWNYDYYLRKKAERELNESIFMHKLKRLYKRELDRVRKAPRARETKSIEREGRFYQLEKQYADRKKVVQKESISLKIQSWERKIGSKVLKINNLKKLYWDKVILNNFSYEFNHGERVWIIGSNWVWKSTFLNMILWKEDYDSGTLKVWDTIVFWYYTQKDVEFPDNKRVIDVVKDIAEYYYIDKWTKITAWDLLERFLFIWPMQHVFANSLSGWEKRRLNLLRILMANPNFLIFDEPTNDLDLITLNILEDYLLWFPWCLIIVSHDRFFMDKIVDHLFVFKGDWEVEDFWWKYSEYRELEDLRAQIQKDEKKSEKIEKQNLLKQTQKLTYMEKREFEQLEKDINKLEARKNEIDTLFYDVNLSTESIQELSKELGEIVLKIQEKEQRWMMLWERM